MSKEIITYLVPIIVVGLIVWRMIRQSRGRPLNPSRLWIRPALLAIFLGLAFLRPPTLTMTSGLAFVAAAVVGVVFGYVVASHQRLTVDPTTGKITSTMSPLGMALFVGLYALRYIFRLVVEGGQAPDRMMAHSSQVLTYTDVGLLFLLALVTAQAWEIRRRVKPLLAEAAAQKPPSPVE